MGTLYIAIEDGSVQGEGRHGTDSRASGEALRRACRPGRGPGRRTATSYSASFYFKLPENRDSSHRNIRWLKD